MQTARPVFLSRQLSRPVRSSDGVKVGRVIDLTVLYDIEHPTVHRLAVGRARRILYLLPWPHARTHDDEQVVLAVD
jgi:sporulation protein YlmC with PRC-barrel domain